MIPHRYAEAAVLIPMLHVKPGKTSVRVVGPMAPMMAAEALRWRDTAEVWLDQQPPIKDSRIQIVPTGNYNHVGAFDTVLLSPDMDPEPFVPLLKKGGILQASTFAEPRIGPLRAKMRVLTGSAVPYREFTPEPLWFVLGCSGGAPHRQRKPPDGARRITERFLPAMFSFGKDEIPFIFGPDPH